MLTIGTDVDGELVLKTLPGPSVPGTVRKLLEQSLTLLDLTRTMPSGLADDLYLAAPELVTNSCAATPDSQVIFKAELGPDIICIKVWDSSDAMPRRKLPALTLENIDLSEDKVDENGGWGLPLLMALSEDRGVSPTPPHGKWVWIRFDLPRTD